MSAYVTEGKRLTKLHGQIGAGVALMVRRIRPSARGKASAGIITDRQLVDAVCLGQQRLNTVLKRSGWTPDGHHRKALLLALAAALDRMQGQVSCATTT